MKLLDQANGLKDALVELTTKHPLRVLALWSAAILLGGAVGSSWIFSSVVAAWAQAIGSVAAIFIAIWLADNERKETKVREDALLQAERGRMHALHLAAALRLIKVHAAYSTSIRTLKLGVTGAERLLKTLQFTNPEVVTTDIRDVRLEALGVPKLILATEDARGAADYLVTSLSLLRSQRADMTEGKVKVVLDGLVRRLEVLERGERAFAAELGMTTEQLVASFAY